MYAAHIGRRIVALHNEHRRDGPPLSPRQFFDEVIFPDFFDDETLLMFVNNAPFDQAFMARKRIPMTHEVLADRLAELHDKLEVLPEPHWHLFIGGYDKGPCDLFSGQITNVERRIDPEESICSWIGAAAGIGVSGGFSLLIDEDNVLLTLQDGWPMYRRYVEKTDGLGGHQLDTWNGWWLTHRYGRHYDERRPLRDFDATANLKKYGRGFKMSTQDWVKVLFALARRLPERSLTAYVYSIGTKGNKTIGFRQLLLPEVNAFADLYVHLFGEADGVPNPAALAALYQTEFGFRTACNMGTIGLRAIQPAKLRDYLPMRGGAGKTPAPPKKDDQRLTFHLYLTWIIAMLDNKDLISLAEEAARTLRAHAKSGTKGRATQKREAEQVLDASGRRAFIDSLTEVVKHGDGEATSQLNSLVDAIVAMPASDFPLLLTLMRFKYHAQV